MFSASANYFVSKTETWQTTAFANNVGKAAAHKVIGQSLGPTRFALHQSTAASTWWCGPRPPLGWVEMAVGLPEGPSYLGHSTSFFRYAAS